MEKYYEFCIAEYEKCFSQFISEHSSKSKKKLEEIEIQAQKFAIKHSLVIGIQTFPNVSAADIWRAIFIAHMYRKTRLTDTELISNVVSADQSWKKLSGHAFEEMIKEMASLSLADVNIEIILQRDLSILLRSGELANEPRDCSWLREQVAANIFDLYAIVNVEGKKYCFGCVQCKTSIRDRVTRDREPSIHAMKSYFWSIVLVLDGDFMKLPKFVNMVNGGTSEFPENGWHGMYVFTINDAVDRIYNISLDFDIFKEHAIKASKQWLQQRQWLDHNWKA